MTTRPASELSRDMILKRQGNFVCTVKSVTKASKTSLVVETSHGRFVYRANDIVEADF